MGLHDVLVLGSASAVAQLFEKERAGYLGSAGAWPATFDPLLGVNLVSMDGPRHEALRKAMAPAFGPRMLRSVYFPRMAAIVQRHVRRWGRDPRFNSPEGLPAADGLRALALDVAHGALVRLRLNLRLRLRSSSSVRARIKIELVLD